MSATNPLLDDFLEEKHTHLLEKGNLGKKKSKPEAVSSNWSGERSWTSLGYVARVMRSVCACGSRTDSLLGIFHREETPCKARRETALDLRHFQKSLDEKSPVEITYSLIPACPACLITKGFSFPPLES